MMADKRIEVVEFKTLRETIHEVISEELNTNVAIINVLICQWNSRIQCRGVVATHKPTLLT